MHLHIVTHIGILSDTHGYLDPSLFEVFRDCDEIWHAGDWGSRVAEILASFKPVKAVYGNIDGVEVRNTFPEELLFRCERVDVYMTHIGGYPPRYEPGIRDKLKLKKPSIFVCGHSHILKIIRDPGLNNLLCINPGAAGKAGMHKMRTVCRLKIDGERIFNAEVVELGAR